MARAIRPSSSSANTVYIERKRWGGSDGAPVTMVAQGGDPVRIVNDPSLASERVTLYVGERPVERSTAQKLSKAAIGDQNRQERGKKDKGVLDQIIHELSHPTSVPSRKQRDGGFNWMGWAIAGSVGWIVLVIAAGMPLAILATPIMGPLFGWMFAGFLKIIDSFT